MSTVLLPSAGRGAEAVTAPQYVGEVELAGREIEPIPDLGRYASASVLVRLHGVPIGEVNVPIVDETLRPGDVRAAVAAHLTGAIAREGVRRALRTTGIPERFDARAQLRPAPVAPAVPLRVTVAVCTRDRPDDLRRCLAAIASLEPPAFEVLVVDNAPRTEASRELVAREFPAFRYVREEQPGLDHARNRAIQECAGEVLAYTDDDVVVDRRWAGAIACAFAEDPAVDAVTGLVMPLELEHEGAVLFELYGGFQKGFRRRRWWNGVRPTLPWEWLGAGQFGTGANMAFRRTIFDRIGRFDPALDVGTPTNGGGDLEIYMRVLKGGGTLLYEPAALVRHRHRRTRAELERQLTDFGLGFRCYLDRVAHNFPEEKPGITRLRRWWWREWIFKRGLRAWLKPMRTPASLIKLEVQGFWRARGRYRRARAGIVRSEKAAPDRLVIPAAVGGAAASPGVGAQIFRIDVSRPLQDLPEAARRNDTILALHWRGHSCGEVRIANRGREIRAAELADAITHALGANLLFAHRRVPQPVAWAQLQTEIWTALGGEGREVTPLPTAMRVSVVIATCDRPTDLRRCLDSLRQLETRRPVETIVVDNRPAAGDTAAVLRDYPEVRVVTERRAGLSYARNAGVAVATGDIIVMTDDDVVVPPDWLERLLAPFARADITAVTGDVRPASLEKRSERIFEAYGGLGRGPHPQVFDYAWFERFTRTAVPTWSIGATANAAFRREIFLQPHIGPLHEALGAGSPTGCSEDTLLFYQILAAGGKIAYEPDAYVWHHHRTSDAGLRRQLYAYSKGHVAYHLLTFQLYRDWRGLVRIGFEVPWQLVRRTIAGLRMRGRGSYPLRLLGTEALGHLAGPWALWASMRRVRRLGPGARPASIPREPVTPFSSEPAAWSGLHR